MTDRSTRRRFLQFAASGVVAAAAAPGSLSARTESGAAAAPAVKLPFQLGMASYTLREFPTEQALEMTKRLGLTRIAFKDFHLKLDATPAQIADALAKVKAAGLELYSAGVIYMKSESEVDRAFEYAKAIGLTMFVGVPNYELLDYTNKKVQQYDIRVAIHNHGPDNPLYPTPYVGYEKVLKLDRRLGLCLDVGHTLRSGVDPADAAAKVADRLFDVHIKDTSAATVEGRTVEIGRGAVDIPKFLRAMKTIGFTGTLALEYEKDAKDPLPGSAESIGYLRGALAAMA